MTDDTMMTAAGFAALAQAYGARLDRWPEAWRAAAEAFAPSPEGRAILTEAASLDAALDLYILPMSMPHAALMGTIIDTAYKSLALRRRLGRWWIGLGLLGAGLAGGLAGAVIMMAVMPGPEPRWETPAGTQTAFGDFRSESNPAQDAP